MKVYSLAVVLAPPKGTSTILSSANDTSSFSFYQRGSVTEFLQFFSRTVAERTPQGQRQSVQENNYTAHVYNRGGIEQLSGECQSPELHSFAHLKVLHSSCYHHRCRIPRPSGILAAH